MPRGSDKPPESSGGDRAASKSASAAAGLEGLAGFDKLLEHRVRLAICVLLSRDQIFTFTQLKATLGETDGSLGAHLKRLEDAGYIKVKKRFEKRKPVSRYEIAAAGREALEKHLDGLSVILHQARSSG